MNKERFLRLLNERILILDGGMGTMIHIKQLMAQWKTVVVALVGLVGLALCSFTISSWLFGREWALCASAPISGGIIAGQMTSQAALDAGRADLAAFAMLVIGCQGFVGIPICNFFVRKYCNGILAGSIQMGEAVVVKEDSQKKKLFDFGWMSGDNTIMFKMAIVGWLGYLVSWVCSGVPILSNLTNANIMYLWVLFSACWDSFRPTLM